MSGFLYDTKLSNPRGECLSFLASTPRESGTYEPFLTRVMNCADKVQLDDAQVLMYLGAGTSVAAPLIPALKAALSICKLVCCDHLPPNLSRRDFDAVVFPGGSGESQSVGLGLEGRERVKRFVCEQGGGYLGICGGAYLGCPGRFGLSLLPCDPWAHNLWKRGEHLRGSIGVALTTPPPKQLPSPPSWTTAPI